MGSRRKKLSIAVAILLGMSALATTAAVLLPLAREELEIRKLRTAPTDRERQAAAERLAEIGSARAIPALLEARSRGVSLPPLEKCVERAGLGAARPLEHFLQGRTGDSSMILWAVRRLVRLIRSTPIATDSVLHLLRDGKLDTDELCALEQEGFDTVPVLVEVFIGGDVHVKEWAAQKLEGIGPQAAAAAPALRKALGDPRIGLRIAAALALTEIEGRTERLLPVLMPVLLEALCSPTRIVPGLKLMSRMGEGSVPAVPLLVACLKEQTEWMLPTLCRFDKEGFPVPVVLEILKETDSRALFFALSSLEKLPDPGLEASLAPRLIEITGCPDLDLASRAALLLKRMGKTADAGTIVPRLLDELGRSPDRYGVIYLRALAAIAPAPQAVRALIKDMKEADRSLKEEILSQIAGLGSGACDAIHAVEELMRTPDPGLRLQAAFTLARLDPSRREPLLLEITKMSELPGMHQEAIRTAARLGCRQAIPFLTEGALKDDAYSQLDASALGGIELRPGDLAPFLAALRSENPYYRCRAARALAEIGPAARLALPALMIALGDRAPGVRAAAAKALGSLGAVAKDALPALSALIRDRSRNVRASVREAMEAIRREVP